VGKEVLKGTVPFDRNIARLEIFSDGENRDDWRIVVHFQDALYNGNARVTDPQFGTAHVETTYGAIKDMALPGGGKVSDMFPGIRALGYTLLDRKEQEAAEAAKQIAQQEETTTTTSTSKA
jgi:hypothetical protein